MTPQTSEEHVDLLIPWYANRTLEADDRERVERHVATCARCRERLEQSVAMVGDAAPETVEPPQHVPARLLVRYADAPESLEEDSRRWIEERIASCVACRGALERLQALAQSPRGEPVVRARPLVERLWEALAGSLLRPAPALAYLLLLLLVAPALWLVGPGRGPDDRPPLGAPIVVEVAGERVMREGGAVSEPIILEVEHGAPVLLRLRTELGETDPSDGSLRFVVQLERDGRVLWSEPRVGGDFLREDGRAVLPLILHTGRIEVGEVYEVLLRVQKAGDPLDGQALFRRSVVLRP